MGTAATGLGGLNAVGVIRSQSGRGQLVALNCQRHGGHRCCNEQQGQRVIIV